MRDFTKGELEWKPWLAPVDLDTATAEQREALKITPSNRAVGAYALVLAHDPDTVKERSPLYNAIMFGPRGLPRADRELGAVVASRINGCAYCASVHAKRFSELAKAARGDGAHCTGTGVEAALDPRRAAIVAFAAKLTRQTPLCSGRRCRAAARGRPERRRHPRSDPCRRHVRLGQPADAVAGRDRIGSVPEHLGEECAGPRLLRRVEDAARRALLHDPAMLHEQDGSPRRGTNPISWQTTTIVMPSSASLDHEVEHFLDHLRVERRCRLVEQHHLGPHGEGAGDRHALLLPAGKLRRIGVRLVGQMDARQQPAAPRPPPRPACMMPALTGASVMLPSTVRWGNSE